MKKDYIKYILLIIFFCFLLFLSPISGDDWGNYLVGSLGFRHMIGQALGMYFDWESRIISRLLINFFTYHKFLWNIVNAVLIVSIIYLIMQIIKPRHPKTMFLLTTFVILGMNVFTFSQVIVWVAGNITYLFVIPLLLGYLYIVYHHKKYSYKMIVLLSFLNIIMPLFVEHMGVCLVFANICLLLFDYLKNKKLNKAILCYLLCSLLGLVIVLISPGSMKRSMIENPYFNKLNLLAKISYNLPNFVYYTYIVNPYLVVLLCLTIYYLAKAISSKIFKIGIYILSIPAFIITLYYLFACIKGISFNYQNNIGVILYFIVFTIMYFILLLYNYKQMKDIKGLFFFMLGLVSNLVMLISPTWGFRTDFGSYVFLCLSALIIIDKYITEHKLIIRILSVVLLVGICFYGILYINVARLNYDNEQIIKKMKEDKQKILNIVKYPYYVNCNINPENSYHLEKFKEYYHIDKDVKVNLIDNHWQYFIFYHK